MRAAVRPRAGYRAIESAAVTRSPAAEKPIRATGAPMRERLAANRSAVRSGKRKRRRGNRRKSMKTQQKRLEKLEKMAPPTEPEFIGWKGNPWTEEQMAEAKRRQPDVKFFWRPLLETPEDTARKMADPTADFNGELESE